MPYIAQHRRYAMESGVMPSDAGDLAYALHHVVQQYLLCAPQTPEPGFQDYAIVLGVLEALKLETYRRQVAPYEDEKRRINGEVF